MAKTLQGHDLPLPFLLLKVTADKIVHDDDMKKWLWDRLNGSPNDRMEFFDELLNSLGIFANLELYLKLEEGEENDRNS